MSHCACGVGGGDAAEGVDGERCGAGHLPELHDAERFAGAGAAAGEDRRDDHRVNAEACRAGDGAWGMRGGGFDEVGEGEAVAGEARFRPVDAVGADLCGELRVGGDQQDQPALAADAREVSAGG